MTVVRLSDWRRAASLPTADFRGSAVKPEPCGNCGKARAARFEISRLVEEDGEVTDSHLVGIVEFCEECARLVVAGAWTELACRETQRQQRL